MTQRVKKPFSKATLYSSTVIFILFGAMGFFSIPAFSVLLLDPSGQGASETMPPAGAFESARGNQGLKPLQSGGPAGPPAKGARRGKTRLSKGCLESARSNKDGSPFQLYSQYLP